MPDAHRPIALYAGPEDRAAAWVGALEASAQAADVPVRIIEEKDGVAPERVDYVLFGAWSQPFDLSPYAGVKAILSLWAGVEKILERSDYPAGVPLARMVEPGLTGGMTDYVVAHVMRAHMDLDGVRDRHAARRWDDVYPPLSSERTVGIIGMGALGLDAARALRALRFRVRGWSRSPKSEPSVESFAGYERLDAFLSETEILVLLAPLTAETRGLMNGARLAKLPAGAHIINAARGPLLPEADRRARPADRPPARAGRAPR
ncbi:MAG: NAD(P)-dependent oxidoreductase [Pseudomonadota bacterium]